MRIIRVFPRKTKDTPDDEHVRIARAPGLFDEADEIHIPVVFTWDKPVAEQLAEKWRHVAPVKIGGPAYDDPGGEFVPGMYVRAGGVITSRGCPNRCWFCSVWKREGSIRELPITEGHRLMDSNILACSDGHVKAVFEMLARGKKQFGQSIEFTGGLEAARLKQWHVDALKELRPKQLFFAYDDPEDLDHLVAAGQMLFSTGHWKRGSHALRCYVLCGFQGDTFSAAEQRVQDTMAAGFMPMAMLYRDTHGNRDRQWMKWQRKWARPAIINQKMKEWCHHEPFR